MTPKYCQNNRLYQIKTYQYPWESSILRVFFYLYHLTVQQVNVSKGTKFLVTIVFYAWER